MKPSTTYDWGRLLMPTRWIARIIAFVAAVSFGSIVTSFALAGGNNWLLLALGGLLAVGILALTFWMGSGELVAGLALVGIAVWLAALSSWTWGTGIWISLAVGIAGVLMIACGWYTLAHPRLHATRTAA